METILEQQRRYHEERERLMDVMVKEMLTKKSTVRPGGRGGGLVGGWGQPGVVWAPLTPPLSPQLRDQINSDHRTRAMQDVSAASAGFLPEQPPRSGCWAPVALSFSSCGFFWCFFLEVHGSERQPEGPVR